MTKYYPPVGFHFKVDFSAVSSQEMDARFQSVSGLSVEIQNEDRVEGGENRFTHQLPLRSKYSTLTLKRGFVKDSELIYWCRDAFENFQFKPVDLIVSLLNEKHEPVKSWNIIHAWPAKWSVSDFNAQENSLVIETLDLNYRYFKLI